MTIIARKRLYAIVLAVAATIMFDTVGTSAKCEAGVNSVARIVADGVPSPTLD